MILHVTLSIVVFKGDRENLSSLIRNCLHIAGDIDLRIYLVDHSPTDHFRSLEHLDKRITYNFCPNNPGFGAGHNGAIKAAIKSGVKYHLVVNPDIHFDTDIISTMVNYMKANPGVGMMMPKVLNKDGSIQYLPKLLPSPFWIFRRKVKMPESAHKKFLDMYELRNVDEHKIYNAPILSGCFTCLNLDAIKDIGMYDDRFFMYFEDFDLSRRMHRKYKTIYFPDVFIYHGYEGGANKSFKLFTVFIKSMFRYFNKWGWFFDTERRQINKNALQQFK